MIVDIVSDDLGHKMAAMTPTVSMDIRIIIASNSDVVRWHSVTPDQIDTIYLLGKSPNPAVKARYREFLEEIPSFSLLQFSTLRSIFRSEVEGAKSVFEEANDLKFDLVIESDGSAWVELRHPCGQAIKICYYPDDGRWLIPQFKFLSPGPCSGPNYDHERFRSLKDAITRTYTRW